jgi:hypothetical protein
VFNAITSSKTNVNFSISIIQHAPHQTHQGSNGLIDDDEGLKDEVSRRPMNGVLYQFINQAFPFRPD